MLDSASRIFLDFMYLENLLFLSDFWSFSLLMLIIVNTMFYLFYLKVEPVFICVSLINAIQITSVSSIIGNHEYFL